MKEHGWGDTGGSIGGAVASTALYLALNEEFASFDELIQSTLTASCCAAILIFAVGMGDSIGHWLYSLTHHRYSDSTARLRDTLSAWLGASVLTFLVCSLIFSSWDEVWLCVLKVIGLCILALGVPPLYKIGNRWRFICFFHRKEEDYFPYRLPRKCEGSFHMSYDDIFESHPVLLNLFVFDRDDTLSIQVDGGVYTREASPLYPVAIAVDFILQARDCGAATAADEEEEKLCCDDPHEELDAIFKHGTPIKTSEPRFAASAEDVFAPRMGTVLLHSLTSFPELVEIFTIPKKQLIFPHQGKRRMVFQLEVQDKTGNIYATARETIPLHIR